MDLTLQKKIEQEIGRRGLDKIKIPRYIADNLKQSLFPWQEDALRHFLAYYEEGFAAAGKPVHLMFNMATGAGKTLLMAAVMLWFYKQGKRRFLFFVNQKNIVAKTENNFLDTTHTKYLFREKIVIDDATVPLRHVENFSDSSVGIEIKFTTIQKLYNDIHVARENRSTLDDLLRHDLVMLADEAHHLNADTKEKQGNLNIHTLLMKNTAAAEVERRGWEHTVIDLLLHKNGASEKNKNALIEFTATIPANKRVVEKYSDKILFRFDLKQFLTRGYTKEISLISSTLNKKERILHALLFHWYRHQMALKHGIPNFKPVVLFRSKTIADSWRDYGEFLQWMQDLSAQDFDFLANLQSKIKEAEKAQLLQEGDNSRNKRLLVAVQNEKLPNVANWIRANFGEKHVIITNSQTHKNNGERTDKETENILNSLEDKRNRVRAIFTVERLTEGWDVLNLFDIVRLYQGANVAGGHSGSTPEATVKEKQLIGRGVRYCPFVWGEKDARSRKFDNDGDHDLRSLEELYYHTYDEHSAYIEHLKAELRKDGYIVDEKTTKTFQLKPLFRATPFFNNVRVWRNRRLPNPNSVQKAIEDLPRDFFDEQRVRSLSMREENVTLDGSENGTHQVLAEKQTQVISLEAGDISVHLFRKAINIHGKRENSPCRFDNLKKMLKLKTVDDLQKNILAKRAIRIVAPVDMQFDDIPANERLDIILRFLDAFFARLSEKTSSHIGGKFEPEKFSKVFDKPKAKVVNKNDINEEIPKQDWYVLNGFAGTGEEKALVEFIKDAMANLKKEYAEVYLLRNEEIYTIYSFDKGQGFQPDFLLFLRKKDGKSNIYYQVFIEPKGEQFMGHDGSFASGKEGWKQDFLNEISRRYGDKNLITAENKKYRLIGLPFYNRRNSQFREKFDQLANIGKKPL